MLGMIGGLMGGVGGGLTGGAATATSGDAKSTMQSTIDAAGRTVGGFNVNFGSGQSLDGTSAAGVPMWLWLALGSAGLVAVLWLRRK